ncbi:MAG TPA: hypothetical protein DD670_01095, partial [Planctomycetaceae bacterium]|nr:hypothetical protein [Planctomycetaceae bacterium]
RVDDLDAKTLAAHWGQAGSWAAGDFNNDGVINAIDAAIMAANWGHGVGETTESAVSEPSAFLLLLGLTLPLLIRRRASAR